MITYTYNSNFDPNHTKVYLDGKHVGDIYRRNTLTHDLYQYFPKGSNEGGEMFETLESCKHSLETDFAIPELVDKSIADVMKDVEDAVAKNNEKIKLLNKSVTEQLDTMAEYAKCMIKATPVLEWFVTYLTVDTTDDEHREEMINKAKEILTKLKGMTK